MDTFASTTANQQMTVEEYLKLMLDLKANELRNHAEKRIEVRLQTTSSIHH
jgi:hypothetical protein